MCSDIRMLKIKASIIFLGTVGSLSRDRPYFYSDLETITTDVFMIVVTYHKVHFLQTTFSHFRCIKSMHYKFAPETPGYLFFMIQTGKKIRSIIKQLRSMRRYPQ